MHECKSQINGELAYETYVMNNHALAPQSREKPQEQPHYFHMKLSCHYQLGFLQYQQFHSQCPKSDHISEFHPNIDLLCLFSGFTFNLSILNGITISYFALNRFIISDLTFNGLIILYSVLNVLIFLCSVSTAFVIGGSAFNSAIILDSALNCFIICRLLVKKEKIHLKEKKEQNLHHLNMKRSDKY